MEVSLHQISWTKSGIVRLELVEQAFPFADIYGRGHTRAEERAKQKNSSNRGYMRAK